MRGAAPEGLEPPGERSLALVMHTWGHPSTFYSWVFMKQYLLVSPRKRLHAVFAMPRTPGPTVLRCLRREDGCALPSGPICRSSAASRGARWPGHPGAGREAVRRQGGCFAAVPAHAPAAALPSVCPRPTLGCVAGQAWPHRHTRPIPQPLYLCKAAPPPPPPPQAGKPDEAAPDRWKVGGPLVPDLDTALAHYPHQLVKLDRSVKSNIQAFLEQVGPACARGAACTPGLHELRACKLWAGAGSGGHAAGPCACWPTKLCIAVALRAPHSCPTRALCAMARPHSPPPCLAAAGRTQLRCT